MEASPIQYLRTYYDMFQMAIRHESTMPKAQEHIANAIQESLLYYGEAHTTTTKISKLSSTSRTASALYARPSE